MKWQYMKQKLHRKILIIPIYYKKRKNNWKTKKTLLKINIIFNGRNDAIKSVQDYGSIIFEAKRKATEGKGLKVLTPKQMLHRYLLHN